MLSTEKLSSIGIGTWGLGGFKQKDSKIDVIKQMEAVTYMFDKGLNFFEVSMWAAEGESAKIITKALKKSIKKREDIFISQAIYGHDTDTFDTAKDEVNVFLNILESRYLDVVTFAPSVFNKYGYANVVEFCHKLLNKGTTRYIGATNIPLSVVKRLHLEFGKKFTWLELGFNFEIREMEEEGLMQFASENSILNIVYQPLRRNRTANRNWDLLVKLSQKYNKTQNQIIMNWIMSKGYKPLTKSESIEHIDELLGALEFKLEKADVELLNKFRPKGYVSPQIDWDFTGEGVKPGQLSNVFNDNYLV